MDQQRITNFALELYSAQRARRTISPLTEREPDITKTDAYQISARLLKYRTANGEQVVGKKIGVTSRSVQEMLNVHEPDFGFLTDRMQVPEGCTVSLAETRLIQPRIEGEIAFMLSHDLQGPGISRDDVLAATAWVAPCFEIVDSRIHNWNIRIEDTIADNASSGIFLLGNERVSPRSIDLASIRLDIHKNDKLVGSGLGSEVQGHPAEAVAWLANTLAAFGISFRKGEIILSGAVAPLIDVMAGDRFTLSADGIATASVRFAD